ncbi:hypothetical protein EPAKOI_003210 [Cupriavidus sp. H18C2]
MGEGRKTRRAAADQTTPHRPPSCSPLPPAGEGVGGEGQRFKMRDPSASGPSTPSPPAPFPLHGRWEKNRRAAADQTTYHRPPSCSPLPPAGEGVGGEGQRFKMRDPSASRPSTPSPRPISHCMGDGKNRRAAADQTTHHRPPSCSPLPPAGEGLGERASGSKCETRRQADPQRPLPRPISHCMGDGKKPALSGRPNHVSPTSVLLPSPACGRGVGGEGQRFKMRDPSASRSSEGRTTGEVAERTTHYRAIGFPITASLHGSSRCLAGTRTTVSKPVGGESGSR